MTDEPQPNANRALIRAALAALALGAFVTAPTQANTPPEIATLHSETIMPSGFRFGAFACWSDDNADGLDIKYSCLLAALDICHRHGLTRLDRQIPDIAATERVFGILFDPAPSRIFGWLCTCG